MGGADMTFGRLFAAAFLIGAVCACDSDLDDVYQPAEWRGVLEKAGGWVPLVLPGSQYRPGSIIQVNQDGLRWLDHIEACRYPQELLAPEVGKIPDVKFSRGTTFGADVLVNIQGITAGPGFNKTHKVVLEVEDHGTETLRLVRLRVWQEEPQHAAGISPICMEELAQKDRYLITEAFYASKAKYTLYDETGAKVKLSVPQLGGLLKLEPDVSYEITSEGELVVNEKTYFAVRRAVRVGDKFEVLGEAGGTVESADALLAEQFAAAPP